MSTYLKGDPYGTHRVIEPMGVLPQRAERVDSDFSKRYDNEILIDVERLNIDAASFRQMSLTSQGQLDGIAALINHTVATRGKQHNPETGSGGVLLGTVAEVGPALTRSHILTKGTRITSLVSLSLTPLRLDEILSVNPKSAQVTVRGQAVLFESAPFAVMPTDMPEEVAMAVLDVCGAAPQVARMAKEGDNVLVLGAGGKSGLLCAYQARKQVGKHGRVVGVEAAHDYAEALKKLGFCDEVIACDARDPLHVRQAALAANAGREYDLSISCVSVIGAEMSAILSTRDRGAVYFFSMNTSFTAAALGAEGVGKDVDLFIGNGYAQGHAELSLNIMRDSQALLALFKSRYQNHSPV